MRVTSKGQVTIPQHVREDMGIRPAETEVEFVQAKDGRWFLRRLPRQKGKPSRFRRAHEHAEVTMSTEELLALTRDS